MKEKIDNPLSKVHVDGWKYQNDTLVHTSFAGAKYEVIFKEDKGSKAYGNETDTSWRVILLIDALNNRILNFTGKTQFISRTYSGDGYPILASSGALDDGSFDTRESAVGKITKSLELFNEKERAYQESLKTDKNNDTIKTQPKVDNTPKRVVIKEYSILFKDQWNDVQYSQSFDTREEANEFLRKTLADKYQIDVMRGQDNIREWELTYGEYYKDNGEFIVDKKLKSGNI